MALLEILDPVGHRPDRGRQLAPRPPKLTKVRFATVDNSKPGATPLLAGVARGLLARGIADDTIELMKTQSTTPHPNLKSVVEQADFVVYALGDCGSCTSWSIRDAADLESMGVATAVIVSEFFEPLARAEAETLGLPDLPVLVVPHPVSSRPDSELVEVGAGLTDRALAGLTSAVVR